MLKEIVRLLGFASQEFEYPRPAESYTVLQTVRHRFNIYVSSCVASTQ